MKKNFFGKITQNIIQRTIPDESINGQNNLFCSIYHESDDRDWRIYLQVVAVLSPTLQIERLSKWISP
jgi:hypothetical protein